MTNKLTDRLKTPYFDPKTANPKLKKLFEYGIWVVIILLSLSIVKNVAKVSGFRHEVALEKSKIEKMQKANQELEAQIASTQGIDFVEKQIRNKLGLVKTGEAVVVLPDADTLKKLAPVIDDQSDVLPDPNWKKWEHLFF